MVKEIRGVELTGEHVTISGKKIFYINYSSPSFLKITEHIESFVKNGKLEDEKEALIKVSIPKVKEGKKQLDSFTVFHLAKQMRNFGFENVCLCVIKKEGKEIKIPIVPIIPYADMF